MNTTAVPPTIPALVTKPEVTSYVPELLHLGQILVPTDQSPGAQKAVRYATQLAEQFGGEIVLLHVIEPVYPYPIDGLTGLYEDLPIDPNVSQKGAVEKALAGKAAELQNGHTFKITSEVRVGRAHDEIVSFARETKTDLIVIGTHGYRGLRHFFLGSTAEKVVRTAPCPVLVVRDKERDFA